MAFGGTRRHSANTDRDFRTGCSGLLTARFGVRIPAPEPNCIGNRESVTELAGERTATVQQRTGEVGAGWHDVYDWLISVGWYFSCLSRKLAVENRNAHFRRQPFFNRVRNSLGLAVPAS